MKKIIILIIIVMTSAFLIGCSKKESNTTIKTDNKIVHEHCSRNGTLDNGSAELNYDIYYTGDVLNKVEAIEKVISSDSSILDQYEAAYKSIHEHYKGLSNYITNVEKDNNSVSSTIIIDYDKVNIDELISIEGEEDNIFEDKIPKVSKWKELAKKVGTKCEVVS